MSEDKLYNKNNECIICFEPIENKQHINFFKNCEHNNCYHPKCANTWINECIKTNQLPSRIDTTITDTNSRSILNDIYVAEKVHYFFFVTADQRLHIFTGA